MVFTARDRRRKEEVDEQWRKFHESEAKDTEKPTSEQKAHIAALGRKVGVKVEVSQIETRDKASQIIGCLELIARRRRTPIERILVQFALQAS